MFGRKRYIVVEEDRSGAFWVALVAVCVVLYTIISFAHVILAAGLGYCGFLLARHIVSSQQNPTDGSKLLVYLVCIAGLGGLGFLGGKAISHSLLDRKSEQSESSAPGPDYAAAAPADAAAAPAEAYAAEAPATAPAEPGGVEAAPSSEIGGNTSDARVEDAPAPRTKQGEIFYVTVGESYLRSDESSLLDVAIPGDSEMVFRGTCSSACSNLDLTVLDASGNSIVHDSDSDAIPAVAVSNKATTEINVKVRVSMIACSTSTCAFRVDLLQNSGQPNPNSPTVPAT